MSDPIKTLASYAERLACFAAYHADSTALAAGGTELIEKTRDAVATAERPEWAKEIAALPDLLEAAETAARAIRTSKSLSDERVVAALEQLQAAIAKAKP